MRGKKLKISLGLMILLGLIFAGFSSALPFGTAQAGQQSNVTFSITAGVVDNFALPPDPTFQSANLSGWLGSKLLKDFDDPRIDRWVAYSFTGLPEDIQAATLEIRLKAGRSFLSHNDALHLTFIDDDQTLPPVGPERWGRRIGTGHGVAGLLPYDWHFPAVDTIVLDLANLPLAQNQPQSAGNLIPALNDNGFLDFLVQDDTNIDYIILTLTVPRGTEVELCHIPPGNPAAAHTIEVDASAVSAHLNHGDTLGECDAIADDNGDDHDDHAGHDNHEDADHNTGQDKRGRK